MVGAVTRRPFAASPAQAAGIVEACTGRGMTQAQAGARFGVSRAIISRVLREQGLLSPGQAALLAGISPDELRALAAAGTVRRVSSAGGGRYLYYRSGMLALAAARPPETGQPTQALRWLRWMWAGVYQISTTDDGELEAWRVDGSGSVYGKSPEELRDAIAEDHGRKPVTVP